MNIPEYGRIALLGAALLGGGVVFAEEGAVLDEATTAPLTLDNLECKTAALSETLILPQTWGDTNAPTVTIEGVDVGASGTNYVWGTGPYFPKRYVVTLDYGGKSYSAAFDVTAVAMGEWGTVDLDNVQPRVARTDEPLTLPAAWGETPSDLKLVWTDESGVEHEQTLDPSAAAYGWGTGPLMPGTYGVKLVTGGSSLLSTEYAVEALGASLASAAVAIDNAFDADPAGEDVRNIANHTNVFKLAWVGAGSSALTLDGEATDAAPDENGDWAWEDTGRAYALYSFTNTVDGSNYVARFRVDSDKVAVLFGGDTNNVLVAKDWYAANVRELGAADSARTISDALKTAGGNGLPFWESYVLGLETDETLQFASNIRAYPSDFVTNVVWDAEGQSNVYHRVATTRTVEVWPMVDLPEDRPADTQADVVYALRAAASLTNAFETVKTQRNDPVLVETYNAGETNRNARFYKTSIRVRPSLKTGE